jgi:hypothetical protein
MRKLKGSGSYLRNQTWKNLVKSVFCLIMFGLVFFLIILKILLTFRVGWFDEAVLLAPLVLIAGFYYYLRRYRVYRGGLEGEKRVAKLLSVTLSNDYYLLNGMHFGGGDGDVDHIVLGPNGVFVIETKNWSGKIMCHGDKWQRKSRRRFTGSPSRQLKKNVAKVQRILDLSPFRELRVWVEGAVVFTNNADLHLNNPTVPILKLQQLPNYITNQQNRNNRYPTQQLEQIAKEIIKQIH